MATKAHFTSNGVSLIILEYLVNQTIGSQLLSQNLGEVDIGFTLVMYNLWCVLYIKVFH